MTRLDPKGLRRAMEEAPMNAPRLAAAAGITNQYLHDLMKGRRTLQHNHELRYKLAQALGVEQSTIEIRDPDDEPPAEGVEPQSQGSAA